MENWLRTNLQTRPLLDILNKNAPLANNSWGFDDFRTFPVNFLDWKADFASAEKLSKILLAHCAMHNKFQWMLLKEE